jgi:uncharacterized protein (TIGR02996 family)
MHDPAPLLAAVLADPEGDAPRLVYADWLEERGECARAELIRVQCELARGGFHCTTACASDADPPHSGDCGNQRRKQLEARERELLAAHAHGLPAEPLAPDRTMRVICWSLSMRANGEPDGSGPVAEVLSEPGVVVNLSAVVSRGTSLRLFLRDRPAGVTTLVRTLDTGPAPPDGWAVTALFGSGELALAPGQTLLLASSEACVVSARLAYRRLLPDPESVTCERGFVTGVRCSTAWWNKHARALTPHHPLLANVHFTDDAPSGLARGVSLPSRGEVLNRRAADEAVIQLARSGALSADQVREHFGFERPAGAV